MVGVRRVLKNVPVVLFGRPLHGAEEYAPFFIIGSGRCGTTLLRAALETEPSVHIPPETHVLGPLIRRYRWYSRLPWTELNKLILGTFEFHAHFAAFEITLRDLYLELLNVPAERLNLAHVLNRVYLEHAKSFKPSATRWGDKTPLNTFYLKEILSVFPDARFIHVLRDGRDVVRSYVELNRYDIQEAAARWTRSVRLSRQFGRRHPDRFTEVRYEDLVHDPRGAIQSVCRFLGLQFSDRMLRHHEYDLKLGDVDLLSHHANVKNPISTTRVGRWREFFDDEEAEDVEKALGPALAAAGYEPATHAGEAASAGAASSRSTRP